MIFLKRAVSAALAAMASGSFSAAGGSAVDGEFTRNGGGGEFAEGREEIDDVNQVVTNGAGRYGLGTPDEERDVATGIAVLGFAAVNIALDGAPGVFEFIALFADARVLEVGGLSAVVAHEDDVGVVTDAQIGDRVKEWADELVHVLDRVAELGLATEPAVVWGIDHGEVGEKFVVHDEKGLLVGDGLCHLLDDIVNQNVGAEALSDSP